MVALALPEEQRGIGIGMNTLIRTIGSAIGPVISTVFMDTYVTWLLYDVNGQFIPVAQVPDYSAFHYMYMVAIALMFLSLIASLFTKTML